MVDFSDWDSAEDAVYDGPDAEQQAAHAKRKAMREYMELSQQIEDELIAEMGQEEYKASQHWINNPLIKPRSKVAMFEEWEARIRKEENERTIKLLIEEGYFCNGHWNHECQDTQNCTLRRSGSWHGVAPCESDFLGGNDCKRVIALIYGEK